MTFADKLKELRSKTGLTQIEMARRMFIKPRRLQGWEQGETEPEELLQTFFLASANKVVGRCKKLKEKYG